MAMEPGDAIFYFVTPTSSWASRFVAAGELMLRMGHGREMYSHVAVVDRDTRYQLEAYWPKTRRSLIDLRRPFEVWRLCGETPERREAGIQWCYLHLNQWYNLLGLLFGWMRIHFHERYCSEFLRSCKNSEGFHLPHDSRGYFSPNQAADFYYKNGVKVHKNKGK